MDILEEKIAHEKHLLSQGVDFKYLPNIQYSELENVYELIEWDEEYSEALNEINSSWCTWQAAKAQAVPERTNQTFEDWLSDPENTKVYLGGYRERADEFAHQAWMASLKAKPPKDKILMPRSLNQKHIDYVVHQLAISSGASLISEVYECLIEAQEPAND